MVSQNHKPLACSLGFLLPPGISLCHLAPKGHQFPDPLTRIVTDECPVGTKNWKQLPLTSPFLSRFSEASGEMPHPLGLRGRLLRGTMCWCSVHYQNSIERPINILISTDWPEILAGNGKLSRPLKGVLVSIVTVIGTQRLFLDKYFNVIGI